MNLLNGALPAGLNCWSRHLLASCKGDTVAMSHHLPGASYTLVGRQSRSWTIQPCPAEGNTPEQSPCKPADTP